MSSQGKAYPKEQQEFIIRLKQCYDEEHARQSTVSTPNAAGRVATGLQVRLSPVKAVMAEDHRTGPVEAPLALIRGKPSYRLGSALETVIRQPVRELTRRGEAVSLRSLRNWLAQEYDQEDVPRNTLWRTIQRLGFVYGPSKRRRTFKERDYVIIARRQYRRQKRGNRAPAGGTYRPEVYLDETYLNVNHSHDNTGYFAADGPGVNKPAGKGPRLIIVHAMTSTGGVRGATLVFHATPRTGDYPGQLNSAPFTKGFIEQLLPTIPPQSFIIRDNAPYHNELAEDAFPTPQTRKAQRRQWLHHHQPGEYREDMLKPDLYQRCKQLCPAPSLRLDLLAQAAGHTIVRTPPYQPALQPIEMCWAIRKEYGAARCDYALAGLKTHMEAGFDQVTPAVCQSLIQKGRIQEDQDGVDDEEDDEEDNDRELLDFMAL